MPKFYVAKIEKNGLLLTLLINDVPIVLFSRHTDVDITEQLNRWIKPGKNILSIYLHWPGGISYSPDEARFYLRLEAVEIGRKFRETPPLIEFIWPNTEREVEKYPYETQVAFDVESQDSPPSRLWREATQVVIDEVTRQTIIDLILQLHQALQAKNTQVLSTLLDFKGIDSGVSHYLTQEDSRKSQLEFFQFFFDIPNWQMLPLKIDALEFHLLSEQRLILVSRPGMEPALQSNDAGPRLLLPLYFAQIDGQWLVVR